MNNVLVVGDPHIPFEHEGYLDFCKKTYKKYNCNIVVCIGDLVDNHAISYHEHDPDGLSPRDELVLAKKKIQKWVKAFPKVKICRGNHDLLFHRKAITHGIPLEATKSFQDIFELPKEWEYEYFYMIDDVKYEHGLKRSGKYAHIKASQQNMQSTVIGHLHSNAGVGWSANDLKIVFGMAVGCGIDRNSYAMKYGTSFVSKPILSCGIVLDNGKYPQVIPMEL
jgi:predicted phosphodiesterase